MSPCVSLGSFARAGAQAVNAQVHVFRGLGGTGVPLATLATQGSVEALDIGPSPNAASGGGYWLAVGGLQQQQTSGGGNGFALVAQLVL